MIIPHIRDIFICGILGHYHKWLRGTPLFLKKQLTICGKCAIINVLQKQYADMAELADAHGSGPCGGNFMQVRLLLSAFSVFFMGHPFKWMPSFLCFYGIIFEKNSIPGFAISGILSICGRSYTDCNVPLSFHPPSFMIYISGTPRVCCTVAQ